MHIRPNIRYSFTTQSFSCWSPQHGNGQVGGKTITRDFGQGNPFPVPLDDPLQDEAVRICAPRGSLILWDSRGWAEGSCREFPHLPGEGLWIH